MLSDVDFYGGAEHFGNVSTASPRKRVVVFAPTSVTTIATLGAPRRAGGPQHFLINAGSQSVTVKDAEGVTLFTLTAGLGAKMGWTGSAWTWSTRTHSAAISSNPGSRSAIPADSAAPTPADCSQPDYQLTPCDGETDETPVYTDDDLSASVGDIVKITGDDRCFEIEVAEPGPQTTQSVTIEETYVSCRACRRVYSLVDCVGVATTIYTDDDLSDYDGGVIKKPGSSVCWKVTEIDFASQTLVSITVEQDYTDCDCCEATALSGCPLLTEASGAIASWSFPTDHPETVGVHCAALLGGSAVVPFFEEGAGLIQWAGYSGVAVWNESNSPPSFDYIFVVAIFDTGTDEWSISFTVEESANRDILTFGLGAAISGIGLADAPGDCGGTTGSFAMINNNCHSVNDSVGSGSVTVVPCYDGGANLGV